MGDGGFGFFDRRWVRPTDDGRFEMAVPKGVRTMVTDLLDGLEELLASDSPNVRRVFPTAYPDDPEREAGYQALVRGELIERHRAAAETVLATLDEELVTSEQLTAWMTVTNALRLVLGTALDVQEGDDPDIDPDDPDAPARIAYRVLTELVDEIVTALSASV